MNAQKTLLSHVDSQPKSEEVILWYDSKEYMDKRDAMIVSAVRTPIGDFGGSLKGVSHTKLASLVMDEVCRRANFPKEDLDDVYWEDSHAPKR